MLVELPFNKFIEMIIEKKSIDFVLKLKKINRQIDLYEEHPIRLLMFKTHTQRATGNGQYESQKRSHVGTNDSEMVEHQ